MIVQAISLGVVAQLKLNSGSAVNIVLVPQGMQAQLRQLYYAFALAFAADRILVLPKLTCHCIHNWFETQQCRLPGDKTSRLPFTCPAVSVLQSTLGMHHPNQRLTLTPTSVPSIAYMIPTYLGCYRVVTICSSTHTCGISCVITVCLHCCVLLFRIMCLT